MAGAVRAIVRDCGVNVAQDLFSKLAAQVTRRHRRATTAVGEVVYGFANPSAHGRNRGGLVVYEQLVSGLEEDSDGDRRDLTLGFSRLSPPHRSGIAISQAMGLGLFGGRASCRFGVGDPVDSDRFLADLEEGLPLLRRCGISEVAGLGLFGGHASCLADLEEGLPLLRRCDISEMAGLGLFGGDGSWRFGVGCLFDRAAPRTSGLPPLLRQCGRITWSDTDHAMRPLPVRGIICLRSTFCLLGFSDGDHVLQAAPSSSRSRRLLSSTPYFLSRSPSRASAHSSACVWPPFRIHGARRLSSSASASLPAPRTPAHQATASGSSPGPSCPETPPSVSSAHDPCISLAPAPPGSPQTPSSSPTPPTSPQVPPAADPSSQEICSSDRLQLQEALIDESSAEVIFDAEKYVRSYPMLIEVKIRGSSGTFWRLSNETTWIRRLAVILKNHHVAGLYLSRPLMVSDILITRSGRVKLRHITFCKKEKSLDNLNLDYQHMAKVIEELILLSNGSDGLNKTPSDFVKYLTLLKSNTIKKKDEFFIANDCSLLPMKNRSSAYLAMYDRIVNVIGKYKRESILKKLPYKSCWLRTASKNSELSKWLSHRWYPKNQLHQLRFNRNVRCHAYQYGNFEIEETLYCEWPNLLVAMEYELHKSGQLKETGIVSKFGH